MRRALFLTVALSVATAWPAAAQNLKVEFHDGRVSVDATAVPVRAILTEWGKVGGTKIVGAERITGAPLTVKLINVTEAQALETILRSVAGYMAAPRNTGAGPSMYDRILVMATTSAPPPAAANARPAPQQPNAAFNGTQRFVPPRQSSSRSKHEPDEQPTSRTRIRRTRRSSRSRSQGQNGFPNQPGQFQNAPQNGQPATDHRQSGERRAADRSIRQPRPQAPIGVSQPGMMVAPPPPNHADSRRA